MPDEKKHLNTEKQNQESKQVESNSEIKKDWAEEAYQELADYIEEQGIFIRY